MGSCTGYCKMLLSCVKTVVIDSHNFELVHLNKKKEKKNSCLWTFWFSTFMIHFCASSSLVVGHESTRSWMVHCQNHFWDFGRSLISTRLCLGMAMEILNLPWLRINQIMAKGATNPKPSMQRERYCLAVHKYTCERTSEYAAAEKQSAEKVGFRHLSSFSYKSLD